MVGSTDQAHNSCCVCCLPLPPSRAHRGAHDTCIIICIQEIHNIKHVAGALPDAPGRSSRAPRRGAGAGSPCAGQGTRRHALLRLHARSRWRGYLLMLNSWAWQYYYDNNTPYHYPVPIRKLRERGGWNTKSRPQGVCMQCLPYAPRRRGAVTRPPGIANPHG